MKKNTVFKALLVVVVLAVLFVWITMYRPLHYKADQEMRILTLPSPPREILVKDKENQEKIIQMINDAPKKFVSLEFGNYGYILYVTLGEAETVFLQEKHLIKNNRKYAVDASLLKNLQSIFDELDN